MAVGDIPARGLNVGVSPVPLVGQVDPSISSPDNIAKLSDAVRQGVISASDIVDRIGNIGAAKNKAALQTLKEYVSPDAIASRQAQLQAAGAQANLATQQATAQQSLVQPMTDKQLQDLIQGNEERYTAPAIQSFLRWGNLPIYKLDPATGQETDQYDRDEMARQGINYLRAENTLNFAQDRLTVAKVVDAQEQDGTPIKISQNRYGDNISPGSPLQKQYTQMIVDSWDQLHTQQPVRSIQDNLVIPKATGTTTPAKPVVSPEPPSSTPVTGDTLAAAYSAGTSPMAGQRVGPTPIPPQREELRKTPQYAAWADKSNPMTMFQTAAARADAPPTPEEQGPLGVQYRAQKDFELVQALRQLAVQTTGGGASGRGTPDLQTKNIEDEVSYAEKLPEWKQILAHAGTLPEKTKQRLIAVGNDYIRSYESNAAPTIRWAERQSGRPVEDLFGADSEEAKLLRGETKQYLPGTAADAVRRGAILPGSQPTAAATPENLRDAAGWAHGMDLESSRWLHKIPSRPINGLRVSRIFAGGRSARAVTLV
jgi:hypothetical protein